MSTPLSLSSSEYKPDEFESTYRFIPATRTDEMTRATRRSNVLSFLGGAFAGGLAVLTVMGLGSAIDRARGPATTNSFQTTVENSREQEGLHLRAIGGERLVDSEKLSSVPGGGIGSSSDSTSFADPLLINVHSCDINCGYEPFEAPKIYESEDGLLDVKLRVTTHRFYSPISFNTRAYAVNSGEPSTPGHALKLKPGDRLRIELSNELEYPTASVADWDGADAAIMTYAGSCEPYGSPNATALHLHGMHVSMTGLGDAVMRTAAVGEKLIFDLEIDEDHPTGTFWYHPHHAESQSLQAAGLMGGAIIVADDFKGLPTGSRFEDLISTIDDKVMLLQWLSYSKSFGNYDFLNSCARSEMPAEATLFRDGEDRLSDDLLLVNGQFVPTVAMTVGVPQRWRLINGATHKFVALRMPSDRCSWYAIANDGVYLDAPREATEPTSVSSSGTPSDDSDDSTSYNFAFLSLGSRTDLIVTCYKAGSYKVQSEIPDYLEAEDGYNWYGEDPGIWGGTVFAVEVTEEAGGESTATGEGVSMAATSGNKAMWTKDEISKLQLPKTGYYGMNLLEEENPMPYTATMSENQNIITMWYTMNGNTFTGRIAHRMRLDETQEWLVEHAPITSVGALKSHNWHMHSFHFQVLRAQTADGTWHDNSPMLDWKMGDWRDTVNVPRGGRVVVRFKPTKYTGLVLHHCHVNNHETAGLKEMVAVMDCSAEARLAIRASCRGLDLWPWAGFNCSDACSDKSMFMEG